MPPPLLTPFADRPLDALTGLPGRADLHDRLASLGPDGEFDGRVSVLFIDIDNFRAVNEALGHVAGDALLTEVARRLAVALARPSLECAEGLVGREPFLGHFAADTFVAIVDAGLSTQDAVSLANHLKAAVAAPMVVAGTPLAARCTVGIARSAFPIHADRLLAEADTALHDAKSRGRGRVEIYQPEMGSRVRRRLTLEADLQRAIENDEITAVYQPIVNLESGRVASFEALARWHHPELGNITPTEFIPIAEDTGLITPLSHALLRRSLLLLDTLSRLPGGAGLRMNVNVSRRQLCDPTFTDSVRDLLDRMAIAPDRLCLEITESVVAASQDGVTDCLCAIKALGVQLHMDDFGTGLSSLSLLQTLPIDGIKIDRSFIQAAEGNDHAIAILHAIISLGRNLKKTVTAEGLETATHVATVIGLECDLAQGWVFGESLPPHAAAWTLRRDFSAHLATPADQPSR